ncbi:hypothetical protein P8935_05010 [Telmatobacter sp. DSM 110680]|uniref:Uncharacterized protein n=1 Tax=Telmatobacter sp. DSM 110680 TaxID=3036704 RepID=A0AAU7DMQ4_9BACT
MPDRIWIFTCLTVFQLLSPLVWCQNQSTTEQLAHTQSIGDLVQSEQAVKALPVTRGGPNGSFAPIHILYIHGINQIGPGDSMPLRKSICKYLHKCTVSDLRRVYVDSGAFAMDGKWPALLYLNNPIWTSRQDWNASAPFIDRYEITGSGKVTIVLDELNWWPLVYAVKCKFLIKSDALLTGPAKGLLNVCRPQETKPDPASPEHFLEYQWLSSSDLAGIEGKPRHADVVNRNLKSGLMDWGFGDAVLALGPMRDILASGIRQMMMKSLELSGVDLESTQPYDNGSPTFFITHSLGSYLVLDALDTGILGARQTELADFRITANEKRAVDYLSEHTVGFYFLANQVALLGLARLSLESDAHDGAPPPAELTADPALGISRWATMRKAYLERRSPSAPAPQIIAFSDASDLLTWSVPDIAGVRVVNIPVRNSGFKIPPFLDGPVGAHGNYATDITVFRTIFEPKQK